MKYTLSSATKFKEQVGAKLKEISLASVEARKSALKTNLFKGKGQKNGE